MHSFSAKPANSPPRALLLHGGWPGHQPERSADFAADRILNGFDVIRSEELDMLRADVLAEIDLLVPVWTFGELPAGSEQALADAVANGLGMLAWHGAASAFLASRVHKLLLGGQFVAHPGGDEVRYAVNFLDNDPLVEGFDDLTVVSEQYYLLVDPAVKVLATTSIIGDSMPWLSGVRMPVAWKRQWGEGRVFYCALGHSLEALEEPAVLTLLRRAASWACRARPRSR